MQVAGDIWHGLAGGFGYLYRRNLLGWVVCAFVWTWMLVWLLVHLASR